MASRCHDIDPLEDLKVAIGFVQVTDFDYGGSVCHVQYFLLSEAK
jgi:hypothetical protein